MNRRERWNPQRLRIRLHGVAASAGELLFRPLVQRGRRYRGACAVPECASPMTACASYVSRSAGPDAHIDANGLLSMADIESGRVIGSSRRPTQRHFHGTIKAL